MKLIVLGSGTAVPHPKRSNPGFWLETGSGTLLLDFGPSVIFRMSQEKLDWPSLDAIWISHFHLDHVGGLTPFLFGIRNAPETRERTKPLRIFGPEGLRKLIENFDAANNYRLFRQHFPLEFITVEQLEQFEILPGVEAVALSTPHTDESLAIHIREGEKTLVYTSDTGFTETIAAFSRNVDLLVIESSFVKDKPVEKHLELAEAMYLIRKAQPKKALLTHLYSEWDKINFENEIRSFSTTGETVEAADGLTINF
jgi:Metal-dependent hydrolases of the beta-lactamase superfamily III